GTSNTEAALAAAPAMADARKNVFGLSRSANPKTALKSVPTTNPSATLLDSAAACPPPIPNSALSTGTTAEAENHSDIASTSHTTRMPRLPALAAVQHRERAGSTVVRRIKAPGLLSQMNAIFVVDCAKRNPAR